MLQSPTDAAKQFLLKLEICLLLEVHLSFYHSFLSCQNTWKADNNELPYPSNLYIGFCVPQNCCSSCHKGIHFPFLPFIFSSLKNTVSAIVFCVIFVHISSSCIIILCITSLKFSLTILFFFWSQLGFYL